MRQSILLFCLCCFNHSSIFAQNLVPNPSFEEYITCPDNYAGLNSQVPPYNQYVVDWYSMNSTPDYFHECADPESFNYPLDNFWGSQTPVDGEAYVGLLTKEPFDNTREYVAVALTQPLTIGQEYYISFFASDNDGGDAEATDCATNNIGLKLLIEPTYYWNSFGDSNSLSPDNQATINYTDILFDSLGWTKIEGSIIADQAYTHLAIGNFFNDASTLIQQTNPQGCEAAYYIDYVCIAESEGQCDNPLSVHDIQSEERISIYPNPVKDLITIQESSQESFKSLIIYNSLGTVVMESYSDNSMVIDVSELLSGVYHLQVLFDSEPYVVGRSFIKY